MEVTFSAVKPQLYVEASKTNDAVEFYKAAFGAELVQCVSHVNQNADQELPHVMISCELKIGSVIIIVSEHNNISSAPSTGSVFCLETKEVDAAVENAVKAGAVSESVMAVGEGGCCAGRVEKVKDPYGHIWMICCSPAMKVAEHMDPPPYEPSDDSFRAVLTDHHMDRGVSDEFISSPDHHIVHFHGSDQADHERVADSFRAILADYIYYLVELTTIAFWRLFSIFTLRLHDEHMDTESPCSSPSPPLTEFFSCDDSADEAADQRVFYDRVVPSSLSDHADRGAQTGDDRRIVTHADPRAQRGAVDQRIATDPRGADDQTDDDQRGADDQTDDDRRVRAVQTFIGYIRAVMADYIYLVELPSYGTVIFSALLSYFSLKLPEEDSHQRNMRLPRIIVMAATYLFFYVVEKTIDWRSRRRSIFARWIEGFLGVLMVVGSAGVAGSSYYYTMYNHGDEYRVYIAIATAAMTALYTMCTIFRKNRNPILDLPSTDGTTLMVPLKKRDDVVEEGRDDHYIFTGEDNSYIALWRRLDQLEKELINRDRVVDMWRSRAENVEIENTELKSYNKWLEEQLHSFRTIQKGKGKAVRIEDPSTSKTADSSDDEDDGVY